MAEEAKDKAQTDGVNPEDDEPEDEEPVDVDLDESDATLKADIGRPLRIRLNGRVLTFPHMDNWEYINSRMMATGDFTGWARGVLSNEDFAHWAKSNIKNYQIQEIVTKITLHAGIPGGLGKSSPSSRSSGRKRRR
jgi:hypothetical protein